MPPRHPLRAIRLLVNEALGRMNSLFDTIYADSGRGSIAPGKLMRALLLQVFHSPRSERQLMERMQYNLLFRWFVGIAIDDPVWDHSVFSKNRDRLLEHEVVEAFFTGILALADKRGSAVQGTLLRRWRPHPGLGEPEELQAQRRIG